jgi:hypothetical protein
MKRFILKTLNWTAGITLAICACSMDSEDLRPFAIAAVISVAWLALSYYANYGRRE